MLPGYDALGSSPDSELFTVHEAAQFPKVPVSWIYEHVRPESHDRLPALKLGKYLRFDARDLRAYIDAKRNGSRHLTHR
jgi:hypothetical protein